METRIILFLIVVAALASSEGLPSFVGSQSSSFIERAHHRRDVASSTGGTGTGVSAGAASTGVASSSTGATASSTGSSVILAQDEPTPAQAVPVTTKSQDVQWALVNMFKKFRTIDEPAVIYSAVATLALTLDGGSVATTPPIVSPEAAPASAGDGGVQVDNSIDYHPILDLAMSDVGKSMASIRALNVTLLDRAEHAVDIERQRMHYSTKDYDNAILWHEAQQQAVADGAALGLQLDTLSNAVESLRTSLHSLQANAISLGVGQGEAGNWLKILTMSLVEGRFRQGHCSDIDHCEGIRCLSISQCHDVGVCDKATGQCSTPGKPDGTTCDDGNANTKEDVCVSAVCAGEIDLCLGTTCTALNQCHMAGECTAGLCSNPIKFDGTPCDDGLTTTVDDACKEGQCIGRALASSASLASLSLDKCQLFPSFDAAVFSYQCVVEPTVSAVKVTAGLPTGATQETSGADVLKEGPNTVSIKVRAEDKENSLTYKIVVTKSAPAPSLTLLPTATSYSLNSRLTVTWLYANVQSGSTAKIELMKRTKSTAIGADYSTYTVVRPIVSGLSATQETSYNWQIPGDLVVPDDYFIRVSDESTPTIFGESVVRLVVQSQLTAADNVPADKNRITILPLLANDNGVGTRLRIVGVSSLASGTSATLIKTAQGGVVTLLDDQVTVQYQAARDYAGTDQFFYTVQDGFSDRTEQAFVTVTVAQPPLKAVNDEFIMWRGELSASPATILNVLENDSGADLHVISVSAAPAGSFAAVVQGLAQFVPSPTLSPTIPSQVFTYVVQDAYGVTATAQVTIRLRALLATDDEFSLPLGAVQILPVTVNDRTSTNIFQLSALYTTSPTVTLPGIMIETSESASHHSEHGSHHAAKKATKASKEAKGQGKVGARLKTALKGQDQILLSTTPATTATTTTTFTKTSATPPVTLPNGAIYTKLNNMVALLNGTALSYTASVAGEDEFWYKVTDGSPTRDPAYAHVLVHVKAVLVKDDGPFKLWSGISSTLDLLSNDQGSGLTLSPETDTKTAKGVAVAIDPVTQKVTLSPPSSTFVAFGDSFTYVTRDHNGFAAKGLVSFSVVPLLARDDVFVRGLSGQDSMVITPLDNDLSLTPTSLRVLPPTTPVASLDAITSTSLRGALVTYDKDGTRIRYAVPPTMVGTDTFTYTATDASGQQSQATVTLTVDPHAVPDTLTVLFTPSGSTVQTVTLDVIGNDLAVAGASAIALDSTTLTGATVGSSETGKPVLRYTPPKGLVPGAADIAFTYQISVPGSGAARMLDKATSIIRFKRLLAQPDLVVIWLDQTRTDVEGPVPSVLTNDQTITTSPLTLASLQGVSTDTSLQCTLPGGFLKVAASKASMTFLPKSTLPTSIGVDVVSYVAQLPIVTGASSTEQDASSLTLVYAVGISSGSFKVAAGTAPSYINAMDNVAVPASHAGYVTVTNICAAPTDGSTPTTCIGSSVVVSSVTLTITADGKRIQVAATAPPSDLASFFFFEVTYARNPNFPIYTSTNLIKHKITV